MPTNEAFESHELSLEPSVMMEEGGRRHPKDPNRKEKTSDTDVIYGVDDTPPWPLSFLLGLQHYLMMFGGTISIPFIICPQLCIADNDPARGYIISTLFFVSGIVTFLQATVGVRLPIIQGGTFSFLAPTFAILALEHNKCPSTFSTTQGWDESVSEEQQEEEWQRRMREVQGAIIVASLFQVITGYFGLIGLVLRFVSPLTIAPAVTMIGLALFHVAADIASKNWWCSMLTVFVMIMFSQYLKDVPVPAPSWKKGVGFRFGKAHIFKLFPVLLSIALVWIICAILTSAGALEEGDSARTDLKLDVLQRAAWFRIPYPFQWGVPTVTAAGVIGMLAGVVASIIESIGDYFACARLSGAPPPPAHAVNRGIGTEGLGGIIAGIMGTGNGTTSYSENIGAIGVTKVASRRVIQCGALLMIVFGLISKFGAFFITLPEPIVGGIFCVMFGMVAAVGLSSLQFVNLNSSRNLFVLGFSLFFGLMLPQWVSANKSSIDTGSKIADQIIIVLLTTSMFVSGFFGLLLDNTIPGTKEERGLVAWEEQYDKEDGQGASDSTTKTSCYDFPMGMEYLRSKSVFKLIPCFPTFDEKKFGCKSKN